MVAFNGWWVLFVFYKQVTGVLAANSLVNFLLEPTQLKKGDLLFEILVAVGCCVIICADL